MSVDKEIEEEKDNYFDVIILGTGLTESIVACAAAKCGKKVLHLDSNEYYGGDSCSVSILI